MDDILLLDTAERYLEGNLNEEEKARFEKLRKEVPEIDQMVVEHSMFLHQIEAFGETRSFKNQLHKIHNKLEATNEIKNGSASSGGKVIEFWHKYKRVTAIAASIATITAVLISWLVTFFSPVPNQNQIVQLNRKIDQVMHNVRVQSKQLNDVLASSKAPLDEQALNGGTSFLIDGKGFLVTNAHVVAGSSTILVQNNKGQEFKAVLSYIDNNKDLAILKIEDKDFKSFPTLPYSIKKNSADLGEEIFTLGYPRDEIVYNEGYMSARTGFNGDTVTCQITLSANPGNSGGPVFNKNGEVIGILSTAQAKAEGVVFAIKSKNVFKVIDELKKEDTSYNKIKAPTSSNVKGMDRVQQIKQIQDCVYMVRSFSRQN